MRLVIRLGDPTSHGGKVASAAGNYNIGQERSACRRHLYLPKKGPQ